MSRLESVSTNVREKSIVEIGRYDRRRQTRRHIQRIQLVAAMGPPGGGRNVITNRLLTRFNVINMTFPAEKQIVRIYGTMLNQQLAEFQPEVKGICECGSVLGVNRWKFGLKQSANQSRRPTRKIRVILIRADVSCTFSFAGGNAAGKIAPSRQILKLNRNFASGDE